MFTIIGNINFFFGGGGVVLLKDNWGVIPKPACLATFKTSCLGFDLGIYLDRLRHTFWAGTLTFCFSSTWPLLKGSL